MTILETERLTLREIDSASDAEFILELLNTPGFLKYIGDRGIRTVEASRAFIETRFRRSYREHGFGLYAVVITETSVPIGICGFVKREGLTDPDLGFAFLPGFEKRGFAHESAAAIMSFGRERLQIGRILAITSPDNENSERLLQKLGFKFGEMFTMPNGGDVVKLFSNSEVTNRPL